MNRKVKKFLGICLDGYPFVAVFLGVTLFAWFWPCKWVAIPFSVLTLWCMWFFRDPDRSGALGENDIVSPADGKIIDIREVDYPYLLEGKALKVSVFMNVFNVHVNRSPISGVVKATKYVEGKFMGAFKEKASLDNEQSALLIENNGKQILCVQIAGLIARRIINRAKEGETLTKGQRYGLIRFGSRVDLYFPLGTKILVKDGDIVKSGQTTLGEMAWQA